MGDFSMWPGFLLIALLCGGVIALAWIGLVWWVALIITVPAAVISLVAIWLALEVG